MHLFQTLPIHTHVYASVHSLLCYQHPPQNGALEKAVDLLNLYCNIIVTQTLVFTAVFTSSVSSVRPPL